MVEAALRSPQNSAGVLLLSIDFNKYNGNVVTLHLPYAPKAGRICYQDYRYCVNNDAHIVHAKDTNDLFVIEEHLGAEFVIYSFGPTKSEDIPVCLRFERRPLGISTYRLHPPEMQRKLESIQVVSQTADSLSVRAYRPDPSTPEGVRLDQDIALSPSPNLDQIPEQNGQNNGPLVVVLDTGVDYNHPRIAPGLIRDAEGVIAYNLEDPHLPPFDFSLKADSLSDHGTHVTGIIRQRAPNARIVPVKGFNAPIEEIRKALKDIERRAGKISVLNGSFGGFGDAEKYVALANEFADTLFVYAAGNEHSNNDLRGYSPAGASSRAENVISVGAVTKDSKPAEFSNFGKTVDLLDVGVDVVSPIPTVFSAPIVTVSGYRPSPSGLEPTLSVTRVGYGIKSGTSMASPSVAGWVAVLRSIRPDLNPHQVRELLCKTAGLRDDQKSFSRCGTVDINSAIGQLIGLPGSQK